MATKPGAVGKQLSKQFDSNEGYRQLRAILDSLEVGAIRLYLNKQTNDAEKEKLLKKLEYELKPIIRQVWGGRGSLLTKCPRGYSNCGGLCVPYSCG